MKKLLAGLAVLAFGAATTQGADDYASRQAAFLAANAKVPGWSVTPSGLQYHPLKKATPQAVQATSDSVVTVNYEGKLSNGKVFDSSFARHEPVTFPLGAVIKGWQEAVPMMRIGEVWEFAIPSELGYGAHGAPPDIPGDSALLFRIELLDVKR